MGWSFLGLPKTQALHSTSAVRRSGDRISSAAQRAKLNDRPIDMDKPTSQITAEGSRTGGSLQPLVRAIWAAGFRAGREAGSDEATSYERGHRQPTKTPDEAWDESVKWRIETEGSYHLQLDNPEHWNDVP